MSKKHDSIRVGTLVSGNQKDPADYIRQILPHGFESFSITFWQTLGTTDLAELAKRVEDVLGDSGAVISSLAMFGNPLENEEMDRQTLEGWEKCIDAASLFKCDIVAGFSGRVRGKSIDDSIPRFKEVYRELTKRAADRGVRLALENCAMGGDWKTGDWNIAHSPEAWELMFDAVPAENLGLEWEPCHQLVLLMEPVAQLRQWVKKVFHVHGKDATVYWDVIRKHGIHGREPCSFHRTPGFGDTNWTDVISELRRGGFVGSIDIEGWHDPVYRGELEMTGQVSAMEYLKRCRGQLVDNPTTH